MCTCVGGEKEEVVNMYRRACIYIYIKTCAEGCGKHAGITWIFDVAMIYMSGM